MHLLGDENFPRRLLHELRADGHDALHALTHYRGVADANLLEIAERESRVLLTLDKHFQKIVARRAMPLQNGGVVLFRVHPATIPALRPLVLFFRNSRRDWTGHLTMLTTTPAGHISVQQS